MNLAFSKGELHKYENGTVQTIGNSSYRYDLRGRVKEKRVVKNGFRPKTWHYSWDDFDRLIEAHTPDGAVWRYSYDAFGRRIKKECTKAGEFTKQQATAFIWQGATLAEEIATNGDKSETTRWHFEPGTFNPLAKEANGNFYPIVTDHLGTPKELFDTDGNCVWQAEHELWGRSEVAFAKKTDNYQPLVDCNLRFQNQWEDKETGLYYNLNRYYDPDSGQYLSSDPIGLEGGLRTHGYVHDPMQWVDPMGLAGCPIWDAKAGRWRDSSTGRFTKAGAVIGRVDDLTAPGALRPGERTLLSRLPDKGNPKANWKQNSSVVRDEMRNGQPIRDASAHKPDNFAVPTPSNPTRTVRQTFTGAERNAFRNKGWTFDGQYWNPPTR
jgi:RHS repeat-associated protein